MLCAFGSAIGPINFPKTWITHIEIQNRQSSHAKADFSFSPEKKASDTVLHNGHSLQEQMQSEMSD
jgi:hypothetical protein